MSHYCVLVVENDADDIEHLLAPYDENIDVAPYRRYADPLPKGWETTIANRRRFRELQASGVEREVAWPQVWGEENNDPAIDWAFSSAIEDGIDPRDWAAVAAHMSNEDEQWGHDERGPYYMSTYNPASKWDWYEVGGRWAGELILRPDGELLPDSYGRTGVMDSKTAEPMENGVRHVSRARKKDIDWERMGHEEVQRARKYYAECNAGTEREPFWRNAPNPKHMTEAEYIRAVVKPWSCYAFLNEKGWVEKGQMGWFGISHDERDDWVDVFRQLLDTVDDDAIVTVVDCHI